MSDSLVQGGSLGTLSVSAFLERLASGEPTPGGGSASALAGALGASLVSMVCNLTLGREKYAAFATEVEAIRAEAVALRGQLERGIDEDAAAYDGVMATYRLPRGTDDEKATRTAAVQEATYLAALVPLALAEASARVIELAEQAVGKTNVNAASDLAVAAMLGSAAMDGAAANVEVNLSTLKDEARRAALTARLKVACDGRLAQASRVIAASLPQ
jgi:formiminotetrahydrofolate cyclodeaminase